MKSYIIFLMREQLFKAVLMQVIRGTILSWTHVYNIRFLYSLLYNVKKHDVLFIKKLQTLIKK